VLNTKNKNADTEAIADRIQFILENAAKYPVVDRRSKEPRPIRPADIAVLARKNDACGALAEAIAGRGISVELARPGLISSPEVIISLAALRILFNPTDAMAAAQLTFLENAREGELESWLLPRLEEYSAWKSTGDNGSPRFAEITIHFRVRDHARLTAQHAANGIEREQRLVRRPLPASFPYRYGIKSFPDLIRTHSTAGGSLSSPNSARGRETCGSEPNASSSAASYCTVIKTQV
jgi:hypothetical protein